MAIIKLDVLDVQGRKLQAYADLDIEALLPDTIAASDDAIHLSVPGELATLKATDLDDDDVFLFEDASDGFAKKKTTRLAIAENVIADVGLQEAYEKGGVSDGRKIDLSALTGDPVWLYSSNLTGDFALYSNWVAAGDLGNNGAANVIFDTKRTLNAGTDGVSDNFVNFEVTRWSIAALGGQTYSAAGAVAFFRVRNTQTAGTLADTTRVIELQVPSGSTHTGPLLYAAVSGESYPRIQIDRSGQINFGSGGSSTYATIGRDAGGGVVINEAGSNFDPVFRVEQPGQPNAFFIDNTIGVGLYTATPQAGLHVNRKTVLFDLAASGQTLDVQNTGVSFLKATTGAVGGTIDIGAGGNSTSLKFGTNTFFDSEVNALTTTRGFHPGINNFYDLGGTSYLWRNAFFNGYVDAFQGFFSNGSPAALIQVQDGSGNDTFVVDTLVNVAEINNGMSLGIGTDTPDRLLEIIDASNPQMRLTATDATYYTDFQSHTTATFGGLAILPAANASGFKAVTLFDTSESGGLALFYDGSDYWIRTTHAGKGINFNTANTFDFNVSFGIKLKIGSAAIDLYVPGSYRVSDAATSTESEVLALYHATSGTAAAGYGTQMNWYLEDGSGNYPLLTGQIANYLIDPTAASVDAGLRFSTYKAGALTELLDLNPDEVVFNDGSNDIDFRIESNGATHMLFIDAGSDYVGINESSPSASLHIGSSAGIALKVEGAGAGTSILTVDSSSDQVILGGASTTSNQTVAVESGIQFAKGIRFKRTEVSSSPTTLDGTNFYVNVDTSGGAVTINLPATDGVSYGAGWTYVIRRDGGSNVTVTPNGSNTINGAASLTLSTDKDVYWLVSNGGSGASGDWEIV